ncbi:MAG: hypothetical protein ACR2RD_10515 [Woeseiaceae bacterium]
MRIVIETLLLASLLTPWSTSSLAADGPPALSHNPFSRPPSDVIRIDRDVSQDDDDSDQPIPLRATMIGKQNRLANVEGRILKSGDEFQGYRLVNIQEQYAVFRRDGRTVTVYVKPLVVEEDE